MSVLWPTTNSWVFVVASLILAVTPGPGVLFVIARTASSCVLGKSTVPMSRVLAVALLSLAAIARAGDPAPIERSRIEYLLAAVGLLHDAQFIRNGKAYDSQAAVDHLRTKLRAAGSRVHTAEEFIRYCGSESSVSGRPYELRFADGRVILAADFFTQKLREFDTENGRTD